MLLLVDIITRALERFHDLNNDYDEKFGYYEEYIRELAPAKVMKFMEWPGGDGLKYMTCKLKKLTEEEVTGPCPQVTRNLGDYPFFTLTFIVPDENAFFKELEDKYGILKSWVHFGDASRVRQVLKNTLKINPDFTVPNPKTMIEKSLKGQSSLFGRVYDGLSQFVTYNWPGNNADLVQVLSMPVFMLNQSIEHMAQVKRIGSKLEQEKKEQKISLIVSAVLLVVPFLGEFGAEAAGAVTLGRMIVIAGEAANTAWDTYQAVKDPSSAPMEILGLVMDAGGLLGAVSKIERLANVRRTMSEAAVAKFGTRFKRNDDALQGALARTCNDLKGV